MIFVRQRMLDRELVRLLNHSRESFDNLKRLQAQILQSEKLASIGQLVGGAAHELNNPITAMLGYSDLLLSTSLSPEQQPIATKIGQYVRRTKSLVASLISFARQGPAPKTPLDLNTLARTALKLSEPQWSALAVKIQTQFDTALPKVLGDSNQLLQVCIQLVANCLHALGDRDGKVMIVTTERLGGTCQLTFATEALTEAAGSTFPTDAEDALGLSACHGILQEHRGIVSRDPRPDGSLVLRMELPITESSKTNGKEATIPGLWQSQPYA
jgi:two-component system NtrC family sensor kinase